MFFNRQSEHQLMKLPSGSMEDRVQPLSPGNALVTNVHPGCSSLEGFFQENGRFIWGIGMYSPEINPYSWVNLTNMLW